jgi:hypothetical protein
MPAWAAETAPGGIPAGPIDAYWQAVVSAVPLPRIPAER